MTEANRARPGAWRRHWSAPCPLLLVIAGCNQQDAALFGKALFGLMIVSFIVIPFVFLREWNRGKSRASSKEQS